MCATHGDDIDSHVTTYTVEDLHRIKSEHEKWVEEALAAQMPKVGFAELEVICHALLAVPREPSEQYHQTPPADKMARNDLTNDVRFRLELALAKAHEVRSYLMDAADLDPNYAERLRAAFLAEYDHLLAEGLSGDALFLALHDFASVEPSNFDRNAAGLAVLGYFFEACEVFQP